MPSPNDSGNGEGTPLLAQDDAHGHGHSHFHHLIGGNGASDSSQTGHVESGFSWPRPAGLPVRVPNDENLVIFRRALGINSNLATATDPPTLEQGRKVATGIYADVIREARTKRVQHLGLAIFLYAMHVLQVVIGAVLTALGPSSALHSVAITSLGAVNTVVAGTLALVKGQGLPERLKKDETEFRRLQSWIEETEALLALGVIGRDLTETGWLVEKAFKKYNAVKATETNNKPESYVRQSPEEQRDGHDGEENLRRHLLVARTRPADQGEVLDDSRSGSSGNALIRLNPSSP